MAVALICVGVGAASPAPARARQGAVEEFPTAIAGSSGGFPSALVTGPDGNLWFTESTGKIVRMSPAGAVTGEFALPSGGSAGRPVISSPTGLAVGPDAKLWFTDTGTDAEGHAFVGKITPAGTIQEFELPTPGRAPTAITAGSDGNLWFSEIDTIGQPSGPGGSIGRITPTGTITEFKVPAGKGMFSEPLESDPRAIALGPDGNVWFADSGINNTRGFIGRITPEGAILQWRTDMQWDVPRGIVAGSDGNMWFLGAAGEPPKGYVQRITPQGTMLDVPLPEPPALEDLTLGPDGNVWFTEGVVPGATPTLANAIGRITPAGVVTRFAPVSPTGGAPRAITLGPDGNLWFGERERSLIGRFVTPLAPVIVESPVLSGAASLWQVLSASNGVWANEPDSFAYRWQSCDLVGAACSDLDGEVGATHRVTEADIGHTLRVLVTATSLGGSSSSPSGASALVAPPNPPDRPLTYVPALAPPQVVSTTMTWRFAWSRAFTLVKALVVHAIPAGASVEVKCRGAGCPFARRVASLAKPRSTAVKRRSCHARRCAPKGPVISRGELNLAALFAGRRLKVGARVSVVVAKAGWIGKSFAFTVRADKAPLVAIQCLAAVSQNNGGGC